MKTDSKDLIASLNKMDLDARLEDATTLGVFSSEGEFRIQLAGSWRVLSEFVLANLFNKGL